MGRKTSVGLAVIALALVSACSPLEEPPGTATAQMGWQPTDQPAAGGNPAASSQTAGGRFYEMNCPVHFSYLPPEGWTSLPSIQSGPTKWLGPRLSTGQKMLFNFSCSADTDTAQQAVQSFLKTLSIDQMETTILAEGKFAVEAPGDAYQMKLRVAAQGTTVFVELFAFSNEGCVVMTEYQRLENENSEQDILIENSMATLRFEK